MVHRNGAEPRVVPSRRAKGSWRRGDHLPETLVFLKLKKNAREFAIFLPFPLFSFFFSPSSLNSTDISSLLFIEKKYDSNLYDSEGNTPTYKARFLGFARYSKKWCNYSDSVARIGTYVSASRCSTLLECSTRTEATSFFHIHGSRSRWKIFFLCHFPPGAARAAHP